MSKEKKKTYQALVAQAHAPISLAGGGGSPVIYDDGSHSKKKSMMMGEGGPALPSVAPAMLQTPNALQAEAQEACS